MINMSSSTGQLFQLNTFETGFVDGTPLEIPSTDSSGITYHPPSGHLFIADSEIAELSIYPEVSQNLFEVTLDGQTLINAYDLTDADKTGTVNDEPTGISYSPFDDHFYITNDNTFQVYRYDLQTEGEPVLVVTDSISLEDLPPDLPGVTGDFEGVAVSPNSGLIYVVDGAGQAVIVLDYTEQFEFVNSFELNPSDRLIISDPEGIAVNPQTDNLFIVSEVDNFVAEYTPQGEFVATYSLDNLSPPQIAAQGLTFGPASSDASADDLTSLYIADGRVDNNDDPEERDGRVYEARPLLVPTFGTLAGEELLVVGSEELVFAGAGDDLVDASGSQGNNRIYSGTGDDLVILGSNDRIVGDGGDDQFFALGDGNTITGGEGADQFWIAVAEFPASTNTITDFEPGVDVIGVAGLDSTFDDLDFVTAEGGTRIGVNGTDLAVLSGIQPSSLGEADFVFA